MRCTRRLLPLLLALAQGATLANVTSLANATSGAKPTIRWMTVDFPPLFMVTGPEHGVGDYAQGIAVARLGGYEHALQAVPPNYQRIEYEMKTRGDVCFAGFLKTPARERFMVFSEPYLMMLPIQLFVPADRPQPLAADNTVDLSGLLRHGGFRLGILGGRRYGASVDRIVEAYKDSPSVYRRYSKDQLGGLVSMMAAHEHGLDGILAYPSEINYLQKQPKATPLALRAYPLKGAPAFMYGYFACSNSDLGRKVVEGINQTIPDIRAQVAELYAQNLTPAARETYLRLLRDQWGFELGPR